MSRISRAVFVCSVSFLVCSTGFAANNRSAVSVNGSDFNPCTTTSPCRSFNVAIGQTVSGGDVIALDSAGYGPFTADRSVRILAAPGVFAGITATSGDAVTLNSGGSTVTLRNLDIIGLGGVNGINDSATAKLYVENCTVGGFSASGLLYTNASNWSGGNLVDISHSTFRGNTVGVHMSAGNSFYIYTEIDDSTFSGNHYGIYVDSDGFNRIVLTGTRLLLNSSAALYQFKNSGESVLTEIESSIVSGNNDGLISDGSGGPSYVRVSNTVIAGNEGTAIRPVFGGFIYSRGNNTFEDNVTAGAFSGTYTAK